MHQSVLQKKQSASRKSRAFQDYIAKIVIYGTDRLVREGFDIALLSQNRNTT
jgi:hypothetical protein